MIPDRDLTHLRPSERELFRRFEAANLIPSATYTFDMHLGDGMTLNPDWPEWLKAMATTLTQRRVDLVATTPTETWIIEFKDRSGASAIGQLLLYKSLWQKKNPTKPPPRLAIVAARDGFDLLDAYTDNGITIWLV